MKKITIIGAGLAGSLLSLYLARRGYDVDVYEARGDVRKTREEGGRSINLALSCRGLTGLATMGLQQDVDKIIVPMRARAIHELQGEVSYQPFGRHENEHINAVLRSDLNALLLDQADLFPKIHIFFDMKLDEFDVHNQLLHFKHKDGSRHKVHYHHVLGADGATSTLRETLKKEQLIDYTREFLSHGYKELHIGADHGADMAREHLHLWPRDSFMLLGNPNRDDSITGSLFLPHKDQYGFEALNDRESLTAFFKQFFPDVHQAMPDLVDEFFSNPTGNMSTIKCSPWYYRDQCLLIGDAAHGVIPFFGQGMNSAFEDCRILDELLDQYHDNWEQVMPAFYTSRKNNTDAVAAMSMDNFHEIHHNIRDKKFNLKKQVEHQLMTIYPERYISKHVMVMFTNTPYAQAKAHGEVQATFLDEICASAESLDDMDWKKVDKAMVEYDKKLADLGSL